jgi:hypothetical protein
MRQATLRDMASSSPQRGRDAAKPAPAAAATRKAAAQAPGRQRPSANPVRRPPAANPARPATVTRTSWQAPAGPGARAGELTPPWDGGENAGGGLWLDAIRRMIDSLAAHPDSDQELIAVVGAVLSSRARWASLRPNVEGLLRAAELAPVVEAARGGDVASRAVARDRLGGELVARGRLAGEAKRSLATNDTLLTGAAVSKLLGARSEDPRQYANRLREAGGLLAIQKADQYVYPAFQFDVVRKMVYTEVVMVGRLLDAAHDPWGVLSWWQSPNARIGDRRPRDLLGTAEATNLRSLAESVVELIG